MMFEHILDHIRSYHFSYTFLPVMHDKLLYILGLSLPVLIVPLYEGIVKYIDIIVCKICV